MGGDNGFLGDIHNIPEALVADVTHVHAHAEALGLPDIGLAQIRQAAAGNVGAGKRVLFVPAQAGDPKTDGVQVFQQLRVVVDASSSLQSQNGGHFAASAVFLDFRRGIGNGNKVAVFIHLPLDGGEFPLEEHNGGQIPHHFPVGGGEAGKALGVAGQLPRPL